MFDEITMKSFVRSSFCLRLIFKRVRSTALGGRNGPEKENAFGVMSDLVHRWSVLSHDDVVACKNRSEMALGTGETNDDTLRCCSSIDLYNIFLRQDCLPLLVNFPLQVFGLLMNLKFVLKLYFPVLLSLS